MSNSNDGRFSFHDLNHPYNHDGNSVSGQGSNSTTCADDPLLSGKSPIYDNRNEDEDDIHHEDAPEKKIHNDEDDEFEEHSDDDKRYEDDDSEEDSSVLVEREGGSFSPIRSAKTQRADLPLMKQGSRIPDTTLGQKIVRLGLLFHALLRYPRMIPLSGGAGKSNIIFSSNHTIVPDSVYWINTDGYFRKEEPTAGYGAIVRDGFGNPIVACSGASKPFSLIYHQLEGVKAGLLLAKKKGIHKIEMCCNSERTREVMLRFEKDGELDCPHRHGSYGSSDGKDVICRACVEAYFLHSQLEQAKLFPLLNNVIELSCDLGYNFRINAVERRLNRAADYLAKQAADVEYAEAPMLPNKLRDILREDACGRPLNGLPYSSQGFCVRK